MDHTITDGRVTAVIRAQGAELRSLRDSRGIEYLWQAGPAWPRCAPVLFPIVGKLVDDRLRHGGQTFRLTQHGFARDRVFNWLDRRANGCRLVLVDSDETRAMYPFAFGLELEYAVTDGTLAMTFNVSNPGTEVLPASFGAHPAFNWPLHPDLSPESYALTFRQEEPAPIRRLTGGLLRPESFPSPVEGRVLKLRDELFTADAIIMDHVASHSVLFSTQGSSEASPGASPGLEVAWDSFRELGIWTKPGSRFLCIEPWLGIASPANFDGPFLDKPGLVLIPPGETRSAKMRIAIC